MGKARPWAPLTRLWLRAAGRCAAANKLCGEPASDAQLIEWGAELGSDVSFFLSLGTAYCTGPPPLAVTRHPSRSPAPLPAPLQLSCNPRRHATWSAQPLSTGWRAPVLLFSREAWAATDGPPRS
jgi:hypothetical protein